MTVTPLSPFHHIYTVGERVSLDTITNDILLYRYGIVKPPPAFQDTLTKLSTLKTYEEMAQYIKSTYDFSRKRTFDQAFGYESD